MYLYAHGFYKALSFMCLGNIIAISHGIQDFRKLGNFFFNSPINYFILIISLLNLSAYPFFLGFLIKHFLLNNLIYINMY